MHAFITKYLETEALSDSFSNAGYGSGDIVT